MCAILVNTITVCVHCTHCVHTEQQFFCGKPVHFVFCSESITIKTFPEAERNQYYRQWVVEHETWHFHLAYKKV